MRVPKSTTLCAMTVSGLLFVLFTTCPAQESRLVATDANPRFPDTQGNEGERSKLSPNALQMARIIGVESDIEKLSSLAAAKEAGPAPGPSLAELSLRQQITDAVIAASLDVDSVAAEIDYEREQTSTLFSLRSFRQVRGGKRPAWVLPNMLAVLCRCVTPRRRARGPCGLSLRPPSCD